MDLNEVKMMLAAADRRLDLEPFVVMHTFERNGRKLHVVLTERLRRLLKRRRLWKSKELLATLRNARYGFSGDPVGKRSGSGKDGIYRIDRGFRPVNLMMKRLFDGFLDKPGSGVAELSTYLQTGKEDLVPVRLVSHGMRLLGVLHRTGVEDWLALVDFDAKEGQ